MPLPEFFFLAVYQLLFIFFVLCMCLFCLFRMLNVCYSDQCGGLCFSCFMHTYTHATHTIFGIASSLQLCHFCCLLSVCGLLPAHPRRARHNSTGGVAVSTLHRAKRLLSSHFQRFCILQGLCHTKKLKTSFQAPQICTCTILRLGLNERPTRWRCGGGGGG